MCRTTAKAVAKMSATDLFNRFILSHNISATPGVIFIRMKDYAIIHDRRSHPLTIFTDGRSGARSMQCETPDKADRKLLELIRDKYNEAERPLLPTLWRTRELFAEYEKPCERSSAHRVIVKDNKPLYSDYPLWNFSVDPVFSLLLRVPKLFKFFSSTPEFASALCSGSLIDKLDVSQIPSGLLKDTIGLLRLKSVSIDELMPRHIPEGEACDMSIDFEKFLIADTEFDIINDENAFNRRVLPPYLLVKSSNIALPILQGNHRIVAWIDKEGTLFETRCADGSYVSVVEKDIHRQTARVLPHEGRIDDCLYVLYGPIVSSFPTSHLWEVVGRLSRLPQPDQVNASYDFCVEGTYVKPVDNQVTILFRSPVMCKQGQLEDVTRFPVLAQRKLDGNRILVYVSGQSITYYSKVGAIQTAKFGKRFDKQVELFVAQLPFVKNLLLDCECYCHDVLHQLIGGWCNRTETSPEFEQLFLYCLSWVDLDDIEMKVERKEEHYMSKRMFSEIFDVKLGETSLIKVNETKMIKSSVELSDFMQMSVDGGYEGLVVYPLDGHYAFGLDRLVKIKKEYDGECVVIGFEQSKTDSTAIAAVKVQAKPYLGIRGLFDGNAEDTDVFFSVAAALTKQLRSGSWTNSEFQKCVGKPYTIICASFSDVGIPIHARFKAQFNPESYRRDV